MSCWNTQSVLDLLVKVPFSCIEGTWVSSMSGPHHRYHFSWLHVSTERCT
jgi:hypothetical protein